MTGGVAEQRVECGGYRTRYLEAGDREAPPLLLLHDGGWGGSASTSWKNAISAFAETRRVLVPDMLGFGGTDKVVFLDRSPYSFRIVHLAAFLIAVGVTEPVDVVGTSFGGSVALRSLTLPESFPVRSAVSIAGTGGPWRTEKAKRELGEWDGTRDGIAKIVRLLMDDSAYFDDHVSERFRWASVPGHFKAVSAPAISVPASLQHPVDDTWPRPLGEVPQPIMLIRCTKDELVQRDWTDHVRRANPDVVVRLINHRHSPNIDRAEELVGIISDFWCHAHPRPTAGARFP
ncbi:alpha/beta hydrolase [Nocardia sp. NPDC050799]|uniref:alpha/beta fold hydrolase n=1 Tax=Nocardia sp. NPDC050799 TaxID=3154842 RepID=UPI0033C932F9